jgi:HK97 family phage major capsid protein
MEQETLKNLERAADTFNGKAKLIDEHEEKLNKVIKAQDKMLGLQNEMSLVAPDSGMSFDHYFSQQLKYGIKENHDQFEKFLRKETKRFSFQMKTVGDMVFSTNFGTASQSVAMARPGVIPGTTRKVHLRQLFSQGTMTGSTFYYMKENGSGEGTIGTVAEGSQKAQVDFDLVEANANAEYIAGWLRISKKMLADVPGMTVFLQTRLLERLLKAEDNQLLNGDGSTPNISGIIGDSNYTAFAGSSATNAEELIAAIYQMRDSLERDPNGIVVRPEVVGEMVASKQSGAGFNLPKGVSISDTGQTSIMGVPVYESTAMTAGKFIVGDFSQGALLLMREPPVVEFFEQDGTNVRENKVTVRVEERIAFPIFGTDYFVYGDLSGS